MDNETSEDGSSSDSGSGQQIVPIAKKTSWPAAPVPPHPLDREWHINVDGKSFGPFTGHQLKEFAGEGRLESDTQVLKVGSEFWIDASEDPVLKRCLFPLNVHEATSGSVSAGDRSTVVQVNNKIELPRSPAILEPGANKSPGLALFLSLIFPGLGQIYNGEVGKGILMFIGCLLLWAILLGWIINIWSMIDAYSRAREMRTKYDLWLANSKAR